MFVYLLYNYACTHTYTCICCHTHRHDICMYTHERMHSQYLVTLLISHKSDWKGIFLFYTFSEADDHAIIILFT